MWQKPPINSYGLLCPASFTKPIGCFKLCTQLYYFKFCISYSKYNKCCCVDYRLSINERYKVLAESFGFIFCLL